MDVGKLDSMVTYDNEDLDLPEDLPDLGNTWYLLIYPIAIKSTLKTKTGSSGIILPETVADSHNQLITCGIVVTRGKLAYKHKKFLDPDTDQMLEWCAPGDFVAFSRASQLYAITHANKRFYVMPDDGVMYKVSHPKHISRYYDYDEKAIERIKQRIKEIN